MDHKKDRAIFGSGLEDFVKIIVPTLLLLIIGCFYPLQKNKYYFLIIAYLIDAGHVYSTMLEVYFDPEILKKKFVYGVTIGSFLLNTLILILFPKYFFYWIFYFTVFHNMRQGLGFVFLERRQCLEYNIFVKYLYYFSTITPFILFHIRETNKIELSEAILKKVDITFIKNISFFNRPFYNWMLGIYIILFLTGVFFLFLKKQKGIPMFLFFSLVYILAFIVLKSELLAYGVLIVSHGIPYFFILEKRISLTHSLKLVREKAWIFILIFFILGGFIEYSHEDILELFSFPINQIALAMLFTPLISHFIFDSIIWRRHDSRFKLFLAS
jgi:hypothetical protein